MVAPHAGAWIEIRNFSRLNGVPPSSHPTRVRGLKSDNSLNLSPGPEVAPHAGAWIEILLAKGLLKVSDSRTPRGCVD